MKITTYYMQLAILIAAGAAGAYAGAAIPGAPDPMDLPKRSLKKAKNFSFNELYSMQKNFLDNFLSPNNTAQAKDINSTIFAEDVEGRVDITRTFVGRELNTEYLFGLFSNIAANKDEFTLLGFPKSYEVTHFAASQNIASASTRFNFSFPLLKGLEVPIQIDTWNAFNDQGQISQYDATFKWWQWTVDYLLQTAAKAANQTLSNLEKSVTKELTSSICKTAQTYCNGTNVQFKSEKDCSQFLGKIRLGEAYELGRNTLLCRMVHQNMVPYRPNVHCPHIGKTGGGYCNDDTTYEGTVTQNYFTNYAFGYMNNKGLPLKGN